MENFSCEDQSFTPCKDEEVIIRQTVDFSPSVWGDFFISLPSSLSTQETSSAWILQRADELKKKVSTMLRDVDDPLKRLILIDEIQRLGISYHVEEEIEEALRRTDRDGYDTNDMRSIALYFRLMRQQGHNVTSDVFDMLKTKEGEFKQELSCDAKGLICLYEASWLGTQEEGTLDDAKDFAKSHLEQMMGYADDVLAARIRSALETPFHRGTRRLEARRYLSFYEEDHEACNHDLLELAKLDFNRLQSLHQAEIKDISLWWKKLGLTKKLSFARDRVVECYFWSLGVHFEPQYSQFRLVLTKLIALASVMDDMFDAYGTLEELQLFEDAIRRWDLQDVNHLPEYMRVYLSSFNSIISEIEEDLSRKGRLHHNLYLRKSIKALVATYYKEAIWANKDYMPSLDEYLSISVMSSGYPMLTCASLIVMGEELTTDALDSAISVPKIVKSSALIARLMDDLVSTKLEQERKHVASSVQCYMNDHGVTEEEACIELTKMVANAWKDMNEEWLIPRPSHKQLNLIALNFARMIEVLYKHEDGYTNPSGKTKENVALLLVHPIP